MGLSFATMLLFVIILGVVSYWQTDKIYKQTESIYNHPMQVRAAIRQLEAEVANIGLGTKDLLLAKNNQESFEATHLIQLASANALQQFYIMNEQYLGPRKDLDEAFNAYITWKTANEENYKLALSGDPEHFSESLRNEAPVKKLKEKLLVKIKLIEDFAVKKGDDIFLNAVTLNKSLNSQLFVLVAVILLLSVLINFILLRNIRKPINELTVVANRFHAGDMNARYNYSSVNELGLLSRSFNELANTVQINHELSKKGTDLSALMLSNEDARKFFNATLSALANHTGSQMAAVYLLSDDKKTFEHFESIGMNPDAKLSFDAGSFEGEFGAVLSDRKIHHIKSIAKESNYIFEAAGGKFIAREIITIPILTGNNFNAIVSLATIGTYDALAMRLIESTLDTLSARVEGILAYQKMKKFSEKLEHQNLELELQKEELSAKSAALTEQNIELEIQKRQLNEGSRLKTTFLSNMSHELRTPLNSVIALSGVLSRRLASKIPEEEYSYLEVIARNGQHLLSLINDILDISRIESGHEEIEISRFHAGSLISKVVTMIEPLALVKNVGLVYEDNCTDFVIESDHEKCHHILQNLIGNAVKFTEIGKVEISCKKSGNEMSIMVSDTGIGIAEDHIPHIFDEFRQADGSTSRRFGGTGLGLAIASKYAQLLNGSISVESTIGKGSMFTLVLPLLHKGESSGGTLPTGKQAEFLNKPDVAVIHEKIAGKTILLVEDSEPAIIQMKDFLEESGYRILLARDGEKALEIIGQTIPDAMILDLMMPGIDGFEVLKSLREVQATAHIPVLILSARHITKDELKMLTKNNIHQLIQKGDVNREDLLYAVNTMVLRAPVPVAAAKQQIGELKGKVVVLVVEDDPDNMTTVKAILSDEYVVIEAVDGYSAIEMAIKYKPNVILMDIALPGLDGIQTFKHLRKVPELQHIPVIALTASAMTTDRDRFLTYGMDAYIAKPIDEVQFFKTMNAVLYGK